MDGDFLKRWTALALSTAILLSCPGPQAFAETQKIIKLATIGVDLKTIAAVSPTPSVDLSAALPTAETTRPETLSVKAAGPRGLVAQRARVFESGKPGQVKPSIVAPQKASARNRGLFQANIREARRWLRIPRLPSLAIGAAAPVFKAAGRLLRSAGRPCAARQDPPAPQPEGKKIWNWPWKELGVTASLFIAATFIGEFGFQALGVTLQHLQTSDKDTIVIDMALASTVTSFFGRAMAPALINKLGLRKGLLGALSTRLAGYSLMSVLVGLGRISHPALIALYGAIGLAGGVYDTADGAVAPALHGQDPQKLENFYAWKGILIKSVGWLGPGIFGAIVAGMGLAPVLIALPAALTISFLINRTLKLPQNGAVAEATNAGTRIEKKLAVASAGFWRDVTGGAKLVWRNPALRWTFLALTAFTLLDALFAAPIVNYIGAHFAHGDKNLSSAIFGIVLGWFYGGGKFFTYIKMLLEQKALGKEHDESVRREKLRQSMLRWMTWGAFALVGMTVLFLPPFLLGWSWASTLPILALTVIPFGLAQTAISAKLLSFFQASVPNGHAKDGASKSSAQKAQAEQVKAMGYLGSASLAVAAVSLGVDRMLVTLFGAAASLYVFGAAALAVALMFLFVLRPRLDKASAPPQSPNA